MVEQVPERQEQARAQVLQCVGDGDGWHPPTCTAVATVLVQQEDCPPDCSHPLSPECFEYAKANDGGVGYSVVGPC